MKAEGEDNWSLEQDQATYSMSSRETEIRSRLFESALPYDTRRAGFVPLPIILRRCQFLFGPREWQIYSYVLMRAGPAGVAWFTLDELSYDLNFRSIPKLKPYVTALVDAGWLLHETSRGRDFYLAVDPLGVIEQMRAAGQIDPERLEGIDELLEIMSNGKQEDETAAASG